MNFFLNFIGGASLLENIEANKLLKYGQCMIWTCCLGKWVTIPSAWPYRKYNSYTKKYYCCILKRDHLQREEYFGQRCQIASVFKMLNKSAKAIQTWVKKANLFSAYGIPRHLFSPFFSIASVWLKKTGSSQRECAGKGCFVFCTNMMHYHITFWI
jgi:hypothetical protein